MFSIKVLQQHNLNRPGKWCITLLSYIILYVITACSNNKTTYPIAEVSGTILNKDTSNTITPQLFSFSYEQRNGIRIKPSKIIEDGFKEFVTNQGKVDSELQENITLDIARYFVQNKTNLPSSNLDLIIPKLVIVHHRKTNKFYIRSEKLAKEMNPDQEIITISTLRSQVSKHYKTLYRPTPTPSRDRPVTITGKSIGLSEEASTHSTYIKPN